MKGLQNTGTSRRDGSRTTGHGRRSTVRGPAKAPRGENASNPAPRVLRIITRLNVGGPSRHVVWLNHALAQHGFETILVTGSVPGGEDDMSEFATAHGISPIFVPAMSRELSLGDVTAIWTVWRLMAKFRPNIVHTHTAKAGVVGRVAGLLYRHLSGGKARFLHTYHGHVFHGYGTPGKSRFYAAVERLLARLNTDRIVVLSEQQRSEIHDVYGVGRASQFRIVPLGADMATLSNMEASTRTRLVVGIVGRLAPVKNHAMFLRAVARVSEPCRYMVCGDGAERAHLEKLAVELGVSDRVEFAGTRMLRPMYEGLDVVALTSLNEGTPLAIIEAMAAGRPVISTSVGGVVDLLGPVDELVTAGGGRYEVRARGITAAREDVDGFAAGLSRILRDEPLRRRLADRARRYVRAAHSRERLVRDVLHVYEELFVRGA